MNSYTVLYIDDEPENLTVFSSRFKKTFNVITALSAKVGLEILNQNAVHLVISDHRMPEMTGVELLEIVRDKFPEVMRIILTAYTESEDIINAINKGGVYFFVKKPWIGDELKVVMDKTLSFYNLRERNRQLTQRLYVSINELEMFYYRISHDLRGPVASQYGIISLARAEKDSNNVEQYLVMLEESIRRLDETLKKIQSSQIVTDTEILADEINFKEMVNQILNNLKEEIDTKGIKVKISINAAYLFQAQKSIVYTLLENLLENSIHFADDQKVEKTVFLEVDQQPGKVQIFLTDNGIGIGQSNINNIFDAFYRGHALSTGNGLGLYVVKKALDTLLGVIDVQSEEGKGTKVSIEIPIENHYINAKI